MTAPTKVKNQRSASANTPEVRIAFPFVHDKRTKNAAGQELKSGPRHDMTILVPKMHTDATKCPNYKFLADLCMDAAGKMWPGAGWPQGGVWPIKDGDVPYVPKPKPGVAPKTPEQIAAGNVWRKGCWVVEASSYLDPGPRVAVLQNGQIVEIPARVVNGHVYYKSGDFGIVNLHAYAYQNEQFGCNFGFDGVLFTRAGEAIGSSGPKSAEQMFGGIAPAAGTGGAPVPPGYAAPPGSPQAAPQPQYAASPAAPQPQYAPPPGPPAVAPAPQVAPALPIPGVIAAPAAGSSLPPFPQR